MKKLIYLISLLATLAFAQSPTDLGPYNVGCSKRMIVRLSDTDSTMRVMEVYIWYPAETGLLWIDPLNAYWDANPIPGDTARPVVFFSHGGCSHPLQSIYFTSHLPSWGFIVISTMHPGSMYGDPDCLDSASLHDTWLNRPGDIEFTRRHFIDLAKDSADLFGVFDTTRMGMSGHSFGARTTYAMLNRSDYFTCGLAFSGNYVDRSGASMNCMEDIRGIHQPIMIQNGTYDWGLPPFYAQEIYDTLDSPKYWVEIHRAGHFHWGDTCNSLMDPQCDADSMLSYPQAHYEILKYGVPFLMHYLMGDSRFDSYLTDAADTFVTLTYDNGTGIPDRKLPGKINITAFPNPFNSCCHIKISSCSLPHYDYIEIFDIVGREVAKLPVGADPRVCPSLKSDTSNGRASAEILWQPDESLESGVYLVRAKAGDTEIVKRVVYLK